MCIVRNKIFPFLVILFVIEGNLGCIITQLMDSNTKFLIEMPNEIETDEIKLSNRGTIDYDDQKLFWFIHITDTQFVWFDNEKLTQFYQFFNSSFQEINPLFIYNTGDLIHANNGENQDVEEWKLYKKALEDNNMNYSIYIDLPGNHDAAQDPTYSYYLNYSLIGSSFNTLQYSFNRTFSFGNYAFIGLNTATESYDLVEFALIGFLNSTELDWYEGELEKYKDFDRIFVFGHHPYSFPFPFFIKSSLSSSGKTFFDLTEEYNVFSYISGHVHTNYVTKDNGVLSITTSNFDKDNGTYRIISLDHNKLSTTIENVGIWPQGIITNPTNEEILKLNINKIRILAWDPSGINSVKWTLINLEKERQITDWAPLTRVHHSDPLWEGDLDIRVEGEFLLKVKIDSVSGEIIKDIIIHAKNSRKTVFFLISLLMIISLISLSIIITFYPKFHIRKFKKNKEFQN